MNYRNFMFLLHLLIGILALLLVPISCDSKDDDRDSSTKINPDCPENVCNDTVHIVYIKSTSKRDVLHFLYSAGTFTQTPSLILMRSTDLSSSLSINWNNLTSNISEFKMDSIIKNGKNFTSLFGLVFTKLYQYEDKDDKLDMNGRVITWGFNEFDWTIKSTENSVSFSSNNVNSIHNLFNKNDSLIELEFSYKNKSQSAKDMPKLFFNTNNTQFNLKASNLSVLTKNPRFAVEFALINVNVTGEMRLEESRSIDDESSPGVFKSLNYYGQSDKANNSIKTFVQWKPVCYVKRNDFTINSISVSKQMSDDPISIIGQNVTDIIKTSLVYYAYGNVIIDSTNSTTLMRITFGISGDKFYKGYILWTASFGYGEPPSYELSITIIMIIIFGLGIPFLLVVIGSIYLVVKKRVIRKKSGSYGQIGESIN